MSNGIPEPPPEMTTFGLALDTNGDIWQYQGANGMIKIGTLVPEGEAPQNTVAPVATAVTDLAVGSSIASSVGTWINNPTSYARQWLRDGTAISGATGTAYTLTSADVDAMLSCQVTAVNIHGTGTATSNELGPIVE